MRAVSATKATHTKNLPEAVHVFFGFPSLFVVLGSVCICFTGLAWTLSEGQSVFIHIHLITVSK